MLCVSVKPLHATLSFIITRKFVATYSTYDWICESDHVASYMCLVVFIEK